MARAIIVIPSSLAGGMVRFPSPAVIPKFFPKFHSLDIHLRTDSMPVPSPELGTRTGSWNMKTPSARAAFSLTRVAMGRGVAHQISRNEYTSSNREKDDRN